MWATDNYGAIWLNGVDTGLSKGLYGFQTLDAFEVNSGFLPGINSLEFRVTNEPNKSTPSGLLVANLTGHAVPLPATAWLLASGLVGLIGLRRRFRSKII